MSSAASYPSISIHKHFIFCPSDSGFTISRRILLLSLSPSAFLLFIYSKSIMDQVSEVSWWWNSWPGKKAWSFADEPRKNTETQFRINEWLRPCIYSSPHTACQACGLTCNKDSTWHPHTQSWFEAINLPDLMLGLSREKREKEKQAILPPWWFILLCLRHHKAEANWTFSSISSLN